MTDFLTTPLSPLAYDAIALLVIAYFAWRGKRRGLVRELSSVFSLAGSVLLAKPLGAVLLPFIVSAERVPGIFRSFIEITIGGVLGYILLRILFFFIAKLLNLHRDWTGTTGIIMQTGGALIGAAFGVLVALVLGWYILSFGQLSELLMQNPRLNGTEEAGEMEGLDLLLLPTRFTAAHREPFAASNAGKIAAALNPVPDQILEGAEVMVEMTQNPEQLQHLIEFEPIQELAEQPSIQKLIEDPDIRTLAEQGDFAGLLNHPAVKEAMADPKIQEILKTMDIEELKKFLEEQKSSQ